MSIITPWGVPGMGTPTLSTENAFLWGPDAIYVSKSISIVSTAVDAGNTPTTDLRAGLVMGKITASQLYKQYDPTATDGSQIAEGVLMNGVRMLDTLSGLAAQRVCPLVVSAPVKAGQLFGLDALARGHMFGRFLFDDDLLGKRGFYSRETPKTANYTVTAADSGTVFTNTGAAGAVTFTLPAIAPGLTFEFLVTADQTVTIVSAEGDNIVTFNDASADSVAFSTAGQKIGANIVVSSNAAGTKWYVQQYGANTMTVAT